MQEKEQRIKFLEKLEKERLKIEETSSKNLPYFIILPFVMGIVGFIVSQHPAPAALFAFIGVIISAIIYTLSISSKFKMVKGQFKRALVDQYAASYYPKMDYQYFAGEQQGKAVIRASRLMSADIYREEDVIKGSLKGVDYYLSEMELLDERRDEDSTTTTTIFKGLLFQMKIPGKNFANGRIESRAGIFKKWFSNFKKHPNYDFSYQTENESKFFEDLDELFPFIAFLQKSYGNLRMHLDGDTIRFLMSTDLKFLDEPKPKMSETLLQNKYFNNMVKQLNSLFFIIESFTGEMDTLEIEEGLQLRVKQMEKIALEG